MWGSLDDGMWQNYCIDLSKLLLINIFNCEIP